MHRDIDFGAGEVPADALRVVVVEDHPDYREQLNHQLRALGSVQVVTSADNPRDAMGWLAAHPQGWDLVVLDIFLSGGHGFEVLRALRDRLAHQRAVFLTSYTRQPAATRALEMGADAVFAKTDVARFLRFVAQQRDQRLHAACD